MSVATSNLTVCTRSDPNVGLMLRLKHDDIDAFGLLWERFRSRVFRQLYGSVQHREDAEDLTQDVFLRVFSHRKTYVPRAGVATWLFRIVHNAGRNAVRSRRRFRRRFVPMDQAADRNAARDPRTLTPPDVLLREERRAELRAALDGLPDRQRIALSLYHLEGRSYAEIARRMQLSPQSVKGLLSRARASLRRSLAP